MGVKLKLSAPDWCFFKGDVAPEEYYRRLAAMGVNGVEMVDPTRWQAARDAGLVLLDLAGPGMTSGLNRVKRHSQIRQELIETIRTAAANGFANVIVFSGNREGQPDEKGIANCIRGIKPVVKEAEQAGVTLLFEMLNSFDHADYQADHSRFGFEVVRGVNSAALKVVYDIYHMQRMGEDTLGDLLSNLDIIAHIHVAETPSRTAPLDEGQVDYRTIVKEVHGTGYQGFWGLEFVPKGNALDELASACTLFESFV